MNNLKLSALSIIACLFCFSGNAQNFQLSGGTYYSIAICENGTVWTWGDNANYQLGRDEDLALDPHPGQVPIESLPKIKAVEGGSGAHALALACDGTVWAWGANGQCQLGDGTCKDKDGNNCSEGISANPGNCDQATPVQVVGGETGTAYLEDIVYISGGTVSSYAITSDGKVVAWGANDFGQAGVGEDSPNKTVAPVYVQNPEGTGPLENVIAIDATDYGCYAIVDDNGDGIGTVYGWGYNANKQFGNGGGTIYLPIAIQTEDEKDLDNITMISGGDTHGLFLDADGYVWAVGGVWGGGNQLGTTDATYDPTAGFASQVLAGEQITINGYEQEPYLANVKQIAAGQAHSMALVEYDGVRYMMAWGTNDFDPWKGGTATGQLGNGTKLHSNTPQFVLNADGSDKLKNIQSISDGDFTSYATTIDPATLNKETYIWGGNYFGQVGDGTTDNALYPTLFDEPECKVQDACPVAELGPEKIQLCPSELNTADGKVVTLFAGSMGANYSYDWEVIKMEDGKEIILPQVMIEEYYPADKTSGAYLNISFPAKVKVTITDNTPTSPLTCNDCEIATDEIIIEHKPFSATISAPNTCAAEASITLESPQGTDYAFFAEENGGTVLQTINTDGSDKTAQISFSKLSKVTNDVYGNEYPQNETYYRVWAEDISMYEGRIASNINTDYESGNVYTSVEPAQRILIYSDKAILKSVKVFVSSEFDAGKTITPVLLGEMEKNNDFVADWSNILQTGEAVTVVGAGELEIPLNFELTNNLNRGTSYWIGFQTEEAVGLKEYKTNNYPLVDDLLETVQIVSYSHGEYIWTGMSFPYGPGYDWVIDFSSEYICGRVPIDIKNECSDCEFAAPELNASSKAVFPTENIALETVLSYGSENTAIKHDVLLYNGLLISEDFEGLNIEDALIIHTAIQQGDNIPDYAFTYDDLIANGTDYTVITRNAENPDKLECYAYEHISFNVIENPTINIIEKTAVYAEGGLHFIFNKDITEFKNIKQEISPKHAINEVYSYDAENGDLIYSYYADAAFTGREEVTFTSRSNSQGAIDTIKLTIIVGEHFDVSAEITDATNVITADGSIDLTVTDAIEPVTYLWSNNKTDEDIDGLSKGTYTVTITDAELRTQIKTYEVGFKQDYNLELSGTVYNGTELYPDATVTLYMLKDGAVTTVETAQCDTYGTYTFKKLQEGIYVLRATPSAEDADKFAPTYAYNSTTLADAKQLELKTIVASYDISLLSLAEKELGSGTINGTVIFDSENSVNVLLIKDGEVVDWLTANNGDEFTFTDLPEGEYEIVIEDGLKKSSESIEITEENGTIDNLTISLDNTTSLGKEKELTIAPQPATDHITIVGENNITAIISDMAGRPVLTHKGENTINISSLSSGTYLLQIKSQGNIYTKTFIKK